MIRAIDIGNFATKDNLMNKFESKISVVPDVLKDRNTYEIDGEVYFVGKGEFDTEYRKLNKNSYFKLLYAMLCEDGNKYENQIDLIVGLPLSQYKNDKEALREKILNNRILEGKVNGNKRTFIITNCLVYLEGLAAVNIDYEGVFVDIGGRTTDAGITYVENGKRKVENPYSQATGTLNLYSDFIKIINLNHGLDLKSNRVERILQSGLIVDGFKVDISREMKIFKEYLDGLISDLNVQYSLRSNNVTFTGGGSLLLGKSIKKRIGHATISNDGNFDNANGFYEYGRSIYDEDTNKF